jgi:hypothetical protein
MRSDIERRINEAAERLMRAPLNPDAQRRHDDEYVRSTKQIDPDTPLAVAGSRDTGRPA